MTQIIYNPNETDETRNAAAALLDSLPAGAILKTLNKGTNPCWPTLWLNTGGKRLPWMKMDPSDRDDGEMSEPTMYVIRHEGKASITILDRGPAPEAGEGLEGIRLRVAASGQAASDAAQLLAAVEGALSAMDNGTYADPEVPFEMHAAMLAAVDRP